MADDTRDSILTTQTLTLAAGALTDTVDQAGDADWIRFAAVEGAAYRFALAPAAGSTVKLGKLALLDASGKLTLANADANQALAFDATASGDVFLKVSGTAPGDYTVSVSEDDYSANLKTTGVFAANAEGTLFIAGGDFAWDGDKDWQKLVLPVTHNADGSEAEAMKYTLAAKDGNGAALTGATFRLLDKSGKEIGKGLADGSILKIAKADTYYLEIADIAGKAGSADYAVSIASEIADDYGKIAARAGKIALGDSGSGSTTGKLEAAKDIDWIRIDNLAASTGYKFTARKADGSLLDNLHIDLRSSTGAALAGVKADGSSGTATLAWGGATAGSVVLAITDNLNKATGKYDTGAYTVEVEKVADDYGAQAAAGALAAGPLAAGQSLDGAIEWGGDRDLFILGDAAGNATPDQEWRLALTPANGYLNLGAKFVSVAGAALTAKGIPALKKSGSDLVAVFNRPAAALFGANADGLAYLDVANGKGGTGSYRVSLASDDYSADLGTSGKFAEVEAGDSSWLAASGEFAWEGDKDWLRFDAPAVKNGTGTVAAGVKYTLGAKDGNDVALDSGSVSIRLLTSTGVEIAKGLQDGSLLKIAGAGTYYLEVTDNAGKIGTGSYTLSIQSDIIDDFGKTTATAGQISLDNNGAGQADGTLELVRDVDWIKIDNLAAGSGYEITVQKVTGGTLDNFRVDLLNSSGKPISGMSDSSSSGAALITWGNSADSVVYLGVGSLKGDGALDYDTGSYTVTINKKPDDAPAGVTTDAAIAPDGTFFGLLDWSGDVDWVKLADPDYGASGAAQEWRLFATGYMIDSWNMKLYDADGKAMPQVPKWTTIPEDAASTSFVDLKPQSTPIYAAISSTKGETNGYQIDLLTDDYTADKNTALDFAGDQASGWTADGNWAWTQDKDWARLDLTNLGAAVSTLQIIDANDFAGMKFTLFDTSGNAVTAASATLNGADRAFGVKGGIYYLQIENTDPDMIGDYHLEIALVGV